MSIPLFLTASVSTRGMIGADFSAAAREAMYLETLRYYGHEVLERDPAQRLIFAENSGWNLGALAAKLAPALASRIEWEALDPSHFDISRGKGYNEILLMNEALAKLESSSRGLASFMKVTGRYPVYNLRYFMRAAERWLAQGGVFYGDMKDHQLFDWLRTGWNGHAAYAVMFATTAEFYRRELAETYRECNDATDDLIENVWYRKLIKYRGTRRGVALRFGREPVCGGVQGSNLNAITFAKSNRSLKSRAIRGVGNVIRTATPWFWF